VQAPVSPDETDDEDDVIEGDSEDDEAESA
jgi:hypothetical protein